MEQLVGQFESWYQRYWRPSIGWSYLLICLFDFLLAPIGNAIFQANFYASVPYVQWVPITLGGGGLYHLSMLAIVGITSYGRSQEKMKILEALAGAGRDQDSQTTVSATAVTTTTTASCEPDKPQ